MSHFLRTLLLGFAMLAVVVVMPHLLCTTQSQPNPIVHERPEQVTGTTNGTTAIVPIPYNVARSIIPAEYSILRHAYEELIPGFPSDMYPAQLEAMLDHDVQSFGIGIGDFQRMALHFPFVDRINDGYTSFRYIAPQLLSASNPVALLGSMMYGTTIGGTFEPSCDGYADNGNESTSLVGYEALRLDSEPVFVAQFRTAQSIPYSQKLFVNISNQPLFGSGLAVCDNFITLYNTSVTQVPYAPVPVHGSIQVQPPYYPEKTTLEAWGYRQDNAFIEINSVPCENLKGYSGTGPGDSSAW